MNVTEKTQFPVLVQTTGYLSDTNNSKGYTVDGDHYCQSCIRISIDPTIENTTVPPTNIRLCLRFTLALRGTAIRASIDSNYKSDPSDSVILKHYGECEATVIDDPWAVNFDDAFLKSKKRPKDEREIPLLFFRFDTTKTDFWDTIRPTSGSSNPRYQLVYYEFDQYFPIPYLNAPTHLIFRLPTEPGKGRSISSDYHLFAIPNPVPAGLDQSEPAQEELEKALKYAKIESLNEEQLTKYFSLIYFQAQPPFKIDALIPQVAAHIIKEKIDPESVLLVLGTVLHQDIEHTPILSIEAHVKEIRKDKTNERRFHTDTKIVQIDLPS